MGLSQFFQEISVIVLSKRVVDNGMNISETVPIVTADGRFTKGQNGLMSRFPLSVDAGRRTPYHREHNARWAAVCDPDSSMSG